MSPTVININLKDNQLFSAEFSWLLNVKKSDHIILKTEISILELKRHYSAGRLIYFSLDVYKYVLLLIFTRL